MTVVVTAPKGTPLPGYRAREAAIRYGYTERHIRRLIADGTLDVIRVGTSVYITLESLDRVFRPGFRR
jgi:excisionase family DNA binding protein